MPALAHPQPFLSNTLSSGSGARNVTWISPKTNQTYPAGQTLIAEWDTLLALITPSFRLCVISDSGSQTGASVTGTVAIGEVPAEQCGSSVNPAVQQNDGLYFVSLAVPNITTLQPMVLQMQDTLGFRFESPPFYVGQASQVDSAAQGNPAPPQGIPSLPAGIILNLTDPTLGSVDAHLNPLMVLNSRSSKDDLGHAHSRRNAAQQAIDPFEPGASATAIAILVPLALIGTSLVIALILCLRRHRQNRLRPLILTEKRFLPRRPNVRTLNSAEDLEYAVQSLARDRPLLDNEDMPLHSYLSMGTPDDEKYQEPTRSVRRGNPPAVLPSSEYYLEDDPYHPPPPPPKKSLSPASDGSHSRSLTDSYFPPVPALPSSPTLSQDHRSYFGMDKFVQSPLEQNNLSSPPPPTLSKLSEKLHVRGASSMSLSRSMSRSLLRPESANTKEQGKSARAATKQEVYQDKQNM
ncbi:hypothetical protein FA15DRAFT_701042 [Coprinopsis marcescibilis]|uniref:Uncharacterized protein n=1 Tax=Coprinopsis marcescibilis TaxID=230819 RepID=A0A5C3L6R7_COPMA|nr:hypothetical protein FA15DRAFT_701042 [Coprinopsis marcescibilis]